MFCHECCHSSRRKRALGRKNVARERKVDHCPHTDWPCGSIWIGRSTACLDCHSFPEVGSLLRWMLLHPPTHPQVFLVFHSSFGQKDLQVCDVGFFFCWNPQLRRSVLEYGFALMNVFLPLSIYRWSTITHFSCTDEKNLNECCPFESCLSDNSIF